MTLLEIAFALPIVFLGIGLFVQMLTAGIRLREVGRDELHAIAAAQEAMERMHNESFREIFRLYNQDPFDDPGGPGTAPGHEFAVELSLDQAQGNGEFLLPVLNTGTEVAPVWEVREDVNEASLGMPRDLNCDVLVDDFDHSEDYTILPVQVRVRWEGKHGPRETSLHTLLAEVRE